MNLERNLAGMTFAHPVMNGPGVNCRTLEEVKTLAESLSSGVITGAWTKEPRSGNPGDVAYFDNSLFSLNSLGMPNPGMPGMEDIFTDMVGIAHAAEKRIGVNVSGFSSDEFVELAVLVEHYGADWVQLNLSCPNVHEGNELFCFSLAETEAIVRRVVDAVDIPVDVKLAPYIDEYEKDELMHIFRSNGVRADLSACKVFESEFAEKMARRLAGTGVHIVTLCNTLGNVLVYKSNGEPAIRTKVGDKNIFVGGLGGPIMKKFVLSQVEIFREFLNPFQSIVAIGGVQSGQDVIDYLGAGADLVQVTTARGVRGEKAIEQIVTEYISIRESEENDE